MTPEDRITTMLLTAVDRPYGSDAPVRDDLELLSRTTLHAFEGEAGTPRSIRSRVRYLAALLPNLAIPQLADALHGVLSNHDLSISDIRMILEGRRLNDPSKKTGEVPVEAIQKVGALLSSGSTQLDAARAAGVSIDTVRAIDEYLGLSERHDERLMDAAVAAVRDGWSVRQLAKSTALSKTTAHRYLQKARSVLVEIGELELSAVREYPGVKSRTGEFTEVK